jgi:hypothetical protein
MIVKSSVLDEVIGVVRNVAIFLDLVSVYISPRPIPPDVVLIL